MEPTRNTDNALLQIQEQLIQREPIFHHPELGSTRADFEAMTAEDFWETGASGRRYSREFVIDTVVDRYAGDYHDEWRCEGFYCQEIAPNHYLLTYTLHQGERITRRATLWRIRDGQWQIIYHQGTIVSEAESKTI